MIWKPTETFTALCTLWLDNVVCSWKTTKKVARLFKNQFCSTALSVIKTPTRFEVNLQRLFSLCWCICLLVQVIDFTHEALRTAFRHSCFHLQVYTNKTYWNGDFAIVERFTVRMSVLVLHLFIIFIWKWY